MWFIFKNNQCIATCDNEPNHEDLETRQEKAYESAENIALTEVTLTNGKPAKKPPYIPTEAEKLTLYRKQRDTQLGNTDNMMLLPDYTIAGKTLTSQQRQELLDYRQALREAPEKSYPDWPVAPAWLKLK